jgi:hypothetical protein
VSVKVRGKGQRERFRLLFLVLAAAAFAAGFGAVAASKAAAEDLDEPVGLECAGKISAAENSIFPDAYGFEFGCNQDIYAFSIVSNREIDSFSTEIIGIKPDGTVGEGEDFFCVGAVPAFGFGCYGTPGRSPSTSILADNRGIGEFTLSRPICDANVQPRFWGVAMAEYSTTNDLVDPPVVRKWMATSEPFPINARAVDCDVLNPKVKALAAAKAKSKKACAAVKKADGKKARAAARKKCTRARADVRRVIAEQKVDDGFEEGA